MRARQDIIEKFSTFIELEDDRFLRWLRDLRLAQNMKRAYSSTHETGTQAQFWSLYWYKQWKANPSGMARHHLTAFVQESCYWAAHKVAVRFSSTQYTLADCFQLAIADFPKILKSFSPDHGSRIDSYAGMAFGNIIRDTLRQRKETDICTDWALLRKLSQKRLQNALLAAGFGADRISWYVLAWTCFKTLYIPPQARNTRQLNQPNTDTLEAIAHYFNQQRQMVTPVPPACEPDTLRQWLSDCAAAARSYIYPKVASLNSPKSGADTGELQDSIVWPGTYATLGEMITQENAADRQLQHSAIHQVLTQAIQQLNAEAQMILGLYYCQGQTQQDIAKALNVKQYTVSRRLNKARATLLTDCTAWSRDTLHTSLTSDVVKTVAIILEEWLHCYYSAESSRSHEEEGVQ